MSPLHVQLNRVRKRLWAQLGLTHITNALLWACSFACVWLLLCRLFPTLRYDLEGALVIVGIGIVAAIGAAIRQRPDLKTAALAADERLGLRERLTSSLELTDHDSPMIQAVHQDALRHINDLDARRDFPLVPTHTLRWLVVPVVLFGIGYVLLPEFDLFGYQERELAAKVKTEAQQEQAKRLEKVAKALKSPDKVPLSGQESKIQELENLSEQLQHGKITEKQALAKVKNLRDALQKDREGLEEKSYLSKSGDKASNSPFSKALSKDLQQGNLSEAKKKMESLKKQLEKKELSDTERKKLATELKEMAKELQQSNKSEMQKSMAAALAKASSALANNSPENMSEAMDAMDLSAEELESVMEQLAQLDKAMSEIKKWEKASLGDSPFCRDCGKKLEPCEKGKDCEGGGECEGKSCSGSCGGSGSGSGCGSGEGSGGGKAGYQKGLALGKGGKGAGMGGPGQGKGGQVGQLPDVEVGLTPTMLPGQVNDGKMLASIVQKTTPDTESEATVQVMSGALVQAQQAAEEALTQEEIPRGSEEFVRQYFGTLEGDSQ